MRDRLILLLLFALAGPLAAAPPKIHVDCAFGWDGLYRPYAWMPVEVEARWSEEAMLETEVSLSVPQDAFSQVEITHDCVLVADVPQRVPFLAKLRSGGPECRVNLRGRRRGLVWSGTFSQYDYRGPRPALRPLAALDRLVVVAGRTGFGLGRMHQALRPRAVDGTGADYEYGEPRPPRLYVVDRRARRLPFDAPAYDAVDVLVLYDPDWADLRPDQKEAVVAWVRRGGTALLVLGTHALAPGDPLAALLPMAIGPARETVVPPETLGAWGAEGAERETVACWDLARTDAFAWRTETWGTGRTMLAAGPVGFGRVGVLAFDPSVVGGARGGNTAFFWKAVLETVDPALALEPAAPGQPEDPWDLGAGDTYDLRAVSRNVQGATNSVLGHLMNIPEMRPISIGWVVALLVGLAVVIGPIDYFVLKRGDRFPLTWITFTAYIGVFSIVAYYGVYAIRAGRTRLRVVSVADVVAEGGGATAGWVCHYSGIWASAGDDYCPEGLSPDQYWSTLGPIEMDEYGMGGGTSRRMECTQQGGGSLPTYLPVSVWSMQCLLSESACGPSPVEAHLEETAEGLEVTIRNAGPARLVSGRVLAGAGVLGTFGALEAQQETIVTGRATEGSWTAEADSHLRRAGGTRAAGFGALGSARRGRRIDRLLEQGAVLVVARLEGAPLEFGLGDRSHRVEHEAWVRLVLLPEGPGRGGAS